MMAVEKHPPLVPKMRFPEFLDEPHWETTPLGSLATFTSGGTPSKDIPEYWGGRIPWISAASMYDPNIRESERRVTEIAIGNGTRIAEAGSLLILTRGSMLYNRVPMGIAAIDVAFNQDVRALKIDQAVDTRFLLNQLMAHESRISINDTGIGAGKIDTDDLRNLLVFFPALPEQKKIADCLGSLNEVIAAEGRKLEALRQHKQGLLQQLFPQPGETTPRLRFPEFRGAAKWKEKRLGDLGTLVSGLTYRPTDVQDGGLLVLRSSNIQNGEITLDDCVYVRSDVNGANLTQPDDVLICVRNGSKSLIGKNAIVPKGLPVCTHGAFMTVFRALAPHFARLLLQTSAYQKQVAADLGATINSINGSQLLKYRFTVPKPEEQQRIADFLSSLDARLAAQAQKLNALKQHKQGLLQQLFPSLES